MKSAVIYYTHFGNTGSVAYRFYDALRQKGEVDIFELQYRQKSMGRHIFLKRIFFRLAPLLVELEPIPLDLKEYDVLCFGIPVRAGKPSAPIIKYLHTCQNIDNKKIVCFYLFSVQNSLHKCQRYIEKILDKKAPHSVLINVTLPWPELYNNIYLNKFVNEAIEKLEGAK